MLPPQAVTGDAADVRRSAMILLSPPGPEPEPETAMPWPVQDSLSTDILFDIEESFLRPSADEHLDSQQQPERQEAQGQVLDASMSTGLETSPHDPEACITGIASREPSSSATSEAQPSLRQALSSTLGAPDRLPLNCIPLLEKLWRREGSAHLRPDLIMATNKTVVSAFYKLLPDLDDCDKNEPDLMPYTLIRQAIVNSYRQVCDSWVQSGSDSSGPLNRGPQSPHHMPGLGFGFGTFEIDSESQRELFKQVMRREIDKAMLLWTKIWAVISSQQINGRGGKGICENILLEAGIILKRMMTEISASVTVTVRSGA